MGGGAAMIELDKVDVCYPSGTIGLQPTTIGFAPRQIAVLLGRSGAGKSTLLRSLNGLVRPTSGRVTVAGLGDIASRGALRAHRRRTAMIFQQHQLIGRLSALRNVLVGRIGRHATWRTFFPAARRERHLACECLERVGLLDKALARVDALSGGEQQRVGIARALAQQPALILADEPVASLDPATSEQVLGCLHDICRLDGIPAIVSLHQLDLALAFADRIVGLGAGRVVFDGPPDGLDAQALSLIYGSEWVDRPDAGRTRRIDETQPKLEAVG